MNLQNESPTSTPDSNATSVPGNPTPGPAPTHGSTDMTSSAIGALLVSAVVMFGMLLAGPTPPAAAVGQSDRAGDYKMLTQEVLNNRELLVVVDTAAKKLAYYEYDISRKTTELVNVIPLSEMPVPPADDAGAGQPGQRKRP